MEKHSQNAMAVARFLESHPKVRRVNYNGLPSNPYHSLAKKQMTGFGGMLSFELDTDMAGTLAFINRLEFCTQAPTLGDVDTLVLHPATSSHLNIDKKTREESGISDSLVRLSTGIEDADDIIYDLEQALNSNS
jgi:cystathionine beta-lyase/cystathionine gamma-synthase